MRAAACSLLDNALSHEGTHAHTHTTASVATFPSEGCGRVHLQWRADSFSCSRLPAAAAACSLINGSLGKNRESTVKVQISRWEITPPPQPPRLALESKLQCATTAEASCPLQIRDSVCAVFVLAGEAAGSVDCCNAGTRPAHRLGNQTAPYSGGRFYLQGHLKSGSCQVLSPPPEVFLCSLMAVRREKERERKNLPD